MNNYKECKGCATLSLDGESCLNQLVPHMSETNSCPCLICLIKSMCGIECEDFKKYRRLNADRLDEREALLNR